MGPRFRPRAAAVATALLLASASPAQGEWSGAPGAAPGPAPEVVFTFDDGPHARYTAMILDELAERDLKAIFYWVGRRLERKWTRSEKRHSLVDRAVREGHVIGNHTHDHVHLCRIPADEARRQIDRATERFESVSGLPLVFFRAPYGDRCDRLGRMLDRRGLRHQQWDIDPAEWMDHDPRRTAQHLIEKLRHLRGRAVVLMHDTYRVTPRALSIVLDWIEGENRRRRQRGARPIRILDGSDLLAEGLAPDVTPWLRTVGLQFAGRLGSGLAELVPGYPTVQLSQR